MCEFGRDDRRRIARRSARGHPIARTGRGRRPDRSADRDEPEVPRDARQIEGQPPRAVRPGVRQALTPLIGTPLPLWSSRREFLRRTGSGAGLLALATLLRDAGLSPAAGVPRVGGSPAGPPKAKSIIGLLRN